MSVDIPRGVLTVVTGVAGSGKSSLIRGVLPKRFPDIVVVDQATTRGSRRSNSATYTGMLDTIRKLFAKANGVKPALFSANSEGACPECGGLGIIYTDLGNFEPMKSTCEVCGGRRYTEEVLGYTLRGQSIADVLEMSVVEAREFFVDRSEKALASTLAAMDDVGIGYLTLGQPLSTLSGGERQRLKLAIELASPADVYVLDEPTTGLHMSDVDRLIGLIDRFVDAGSTVIVIEHNLDVISRADHVLDLGPGRGCRRRTRRLRRPTGRPGGRPGLPDRRAPGPPPRDPALGAEIVGSTRDRGCTPTFSRRTHDLVAVLDRQDQPAGSSVRVAASCSTRRQRDAVDSRSDQSGGLQQQQRTSAVVLPRALGRHAVEHPLHAAAEPGRRLDVVRHRAAGRPVAARAPARAGPRARRPRSTSRTSRPRCRRNGRAGPGGRCRPPGAGPARRPRSLSPRRPAASRG